MTSRFGIPEEEYEYFVAAAQAMRASGGAAALDALGWWELLPQLDDADLRMAAFALFRAQGHELGTSPALGGLLAQPYLDGTAISPGTVVATVRRRSVHREHAHVLLGHPDDRQLLVDRPGYGAALLDLNQVDLRPLEMPGRMVAHEVRGDWGAVAPLVAEPEALVARARSQFLGRTALAFEMLGAAEAAVELALEHAGNREQFGEPIGRFQAVRHLLAWARTDCIAVWDVARQAIVLDTAAPARYDEVVKAIAGRNGRRACERALQVLGGIGFTAEHEHHHFHSRVLALDALLGTSSELTHRLGAWLRTERTDPGFTSAVLAGAS